MSRVLQSRWSLVAVVVLVGLGLWFVGEETAYFATTGDDDATEVEFSVNVRNYRHDVDDAANSLWYACIGVINWESASAPEQVGENRYRATVVPSLGEDQHRRFRGCLQDGTIDKVRGSVVRMVGIDLPHDVDDAPQGDD